MIETKYLKKSFAVKQKRRVQTVEAVKDVSFHAQDGKITGLLGPNGAGKSTTLRMLATLLSPDSGSGEIDSHSLSGDTQKVRATIGFLPHNAGIYPRLSARENIRYYGKLCGIENKVLDERIEEIIETLDMQSFADRRTDGFSQGQQTRVALARAIIHKPQTLLLDEPTNGLDVLATRNLRQTLRKLADAGHCVLLSSHIMQEIEISCDHIVIINDGRTAIEGNIHSILSATGTDSLENAFVDLVTKGEVSA